MPPQLSDLFKVLDTYNARTSQKKFLEINYSSHDKRFSKFSGLFSQNQMEIDTPLFFLLSNCFSFCSFLISEVILSTPEDSIRPFYQNAQNYLKIERKLIFWVEGRQKEFFDRFGGFLEGVNELNQLLEKMKEKECDMYSKENIFIRQFQ